MPLRKFDFVIIGAGLSGLSFAIRLLPILSREKKSLLILDQRKSFEQDKHWCGWSINPHPFEHLIKKRWQTIALQYKHNKNILSLECAYQIIASSDFYEYCLNQLKDYDIPLELETTVLDFGENIIHTPKGEIQAKWIIDARAPKPRDIDIENEPSALLQVFHGWHIQCDNESFDEKMAHFMDFSPSQENGILFNYLLPLSKTEALIEPTYFLHHAKIPTKEHFQELMSKGLNEMGIHDYQILHHESGCLPMKQMYETPPSGVIPIGTNAGLLRPSTGYAFDGIQRHQDALIHHYLKYDTLKPIPAYRPHTLWMDNLFLKVLKQNPQRGAEIFFSLFESAPTDRIIRFLSDKGSFRDCLAVIMGVPKRPFIKSLLN